MNTVMGIVGLAIFLWGAISSNKKRIKRRDFHSAKDCITKGWDFEANLMLRYLAILVGGCMLAAAIMGGKEKFVEECTPKNELDKFTGIFLLFFLLAWPTVLIIMRRAICHHFEKERDEHWERRKKYGIKLMGEDFPGQYRTPRDNPSLPGYKKRKHL